MKLELKHLAPYLPYGLEVEHEGHIAVIVSLYLPAGHPNNHDLWIVSMEDKNDRELSCGANFKEVKPILRPLSDLTKEIEVNGDKFVPHIKLGGRPNLKDYDIEYLSKNIDNISYGLVSKLIEWHFDVFGLIEKGLAIDINTLQNP